MPSCSVNLRRTCMEPLRLRLRSPSEAAAGPCCAPALRLLLPPPPADAEWEDSTRTDSQQVSSWSRLKASGQQAAVQADQQRHTQFPRRSAPASPPVPPAVQPGCPSMRQRRRRPASRTWLPRMHCDGFEEALSELGIKARIGSSNTSYHGVRVPPLLPGQLQATLHERQRVDKRGPAQVVEAAERRGHLRNGGMRGAPRVGVTYGRGQAAADSRRGIRPTQLAPRTACAQNCGSRARPRRCKSWNEGCQAGAARRSEQGCSNLLGRLGTVVASFNPYISGAWLVLLLAPLAVWQCVRPCLQQRQR